MPSKTPSPPTDEKTILIVCSDIKKDGTLSKRQKERIQRALVSNQKGDDRSSRQKNLDSVRLISSAYRYYPALFEEGGEKQEIVLDLTPGNHGSGAVAISQDERVIAAYNIFKNRYGEEYADSLLDALDKYKNGCYKEAGALYTKAFNRSHDPRCAHYVAMCIRKMLDTPGFTGDRGEMTKTMNQMFSIAASREKENNESHQEIPPPSPEDLIPSSETPLPPPSPEEPDQSSEELAPSSGELGCSLESIVFDASDEVPLVDKFEQYCEGDEMAFYHLVTRQ